MIKFKDVILKNISFINILLLYYPTVFFVRVVVFETNSFLNGFVVLFLSLYFGILIKTDKIKKLFNIDRLNKSILMNILGSLLIFLCIYWFFKDLGSIRCLFEIIFALIFFQAGIKKQKKDYLNIIDTRDIFIGILGLIFLNIELFIKDLKIPILLYINTFFSVFTLLILFNQVNIDSEFLNKSYKKSILYYIRKFNFNLIFKTCSFIIILFNLNFIVKYIIKLFLKLGILIVNLFMKFVYVYPGNVDFKELIIVIIIFTTILIKYIPKIINFIRSN